MRDQIGIATIRGGGMGIVLDGETKVSGGGVAGQFGNVFARAQKFDHREREVGEAQRIGGFLLDEKLIQRF